MYPGSWWGKSFVATCVAVGTVFSLGFASHAVAAVVPSYANLPPITDSLGAPAMVAVGPDERIFVLEPSNQRVLAYDSSGRHLASLSALADPSALAAGRDGRLYVADAEHGKVAVYGRDLKPVAVLGAGDGEFVRPVAMAVDAAGAVYVLDAKAHQVRVYNPDHSFRFAFGGRGTGDGAFTTATGIAIDDLAGEVLVADLADPGNGVIARIQVFDLNGVFKRRIPTGGRPTGLATDRAGRIYLADAYRNTVLVLDAVGTYLGTLSDPARPLRTPVGMAYAPMTSRLLIASRRSASIELYGIDDYRTEMHPDDEDGMPVDWELAHGLDPWNGADAAADADGDGFTNLQEYEANSDPNDAGSNPGRLRFVIDGLRAGEGDSAVLAVVREGGSVGAAAVLCSSMPATASAGSDYTETSLWLEWADGDGAARDCVVPIIDDAEAEGDERFQVELTSASGARLVSPDSASVVIAENDSNRAVNDFNGDGKSDVLLRNRRTHAWRYHPMNGAQVLDAEGSPGLTADPDWAVAGTADYDGDGKADVLLRHAKSNQWHYYPLDGGRVLADGGRVDLPRGAEWQAAGIGDFDGDGKDEVLLLHANEQQWRYYAVDAGRGRRIDDGVSLTQQRDWQLAGIGDFDADGSDDLLLRHARTGQWHFRAWSSGANRDAAVRAGVMALPRDRQWQVAGIGDYNGDGGADVLLRHASGGHWQYHPLSGGGAFDGAAVAVPLAADGNWLPASR